MVLKLVCNGAEWSHFAFWGGEERLPVTLTCFRANRKLLMLVGHRKQTRTLPGSGQAGWQRDAVSGVMVEDRVNRY
ncbi:E3 ubiquitin-protein ligase TRIM39-like protein [Anopheles sinensis]|uniref:E3 ubiquitin-protein ligase TRIM39-like protein n=1 Tax=Anopheles sinensis TaxID=74873 RepID=A0A084WJ62_ANOSI|nr:E3 ubiquitin-protein ligase TRIM39-like protein [Anopheles sinensis]